jgi:hypothetical protein
MVLGDQASRVDSSDSSELLSHACARLESAVSAMPSDFSLLTAWGDLIARRLAFASLLDPFHNEIDEIFELAREKLQMSLAVNENYVPSLGALARVEGLSGRVESATSAISRLLERAAPALSTVGSSSTQDLLPFEYLESPLAARGEWEDLVEEVERRRLDGFRTERLLPFVESLAIACRALGDSRGSEATPLVGSVEFRTTEPYPVQSYLHVPHQVGTATQSRILKCLVQCAFPLLCSTRSAEAGSAWPSLSQRSDKDAKMRAIIELLLSLQPDALDDILVDAADLDSSDSRLGTPPLGYIFFLVGIRPKSTSDDDEGRPKALAPKLQGRVEQVLFPAIAGSSLATRIHLTGWAGGKLFDETYQGDESHQLAWTSVFYFLPMVLRHVSRARIEFQNDPGDDWQEFLAEAQTSDPVKLDDLLIGNKAFSTGAILALSHLVCGTKSLTSWVFSLSLVPNCVVC